MGNRRFRKFYIFSLTGVATASFYPIYMGILVLGEMLRNGAVPMENYPKYVIPYTPIALAVIGGVILIPILQKLPGKLDFGAGVMISTGIFFIAERLMETEILVQTEEKIPLESWQMSLCFVPPQQYQTRTWQAVDILLGGYNPAFKLHFYIISVVLVVSLLNCFYGFGRMIRQENDTRRKALTVQAVTSFSFLGMCIWACFTSFYRTGEITVSAVSAVLMAIFFALSGITVGVFAGSFTLGKSAKLSILLPAAVSAITTFIMYIGEMILLSGNLYRFGSGLFFDGMGDIVLAPADLLVILVSGGVTALVCRKLNHGKSFSRS